MKRSHIGILVPKQREQRRILQVYKDYAPIHVVLFTFMPSSISWSKKKIRGLCYINGRYRIKMFPFPEAVYNRYYGVKAAFFQRLEKVIGVNKCFNHLTRLNKQHIHNILRITELEAYLPETLTYNETKLTCLLEKHKIVYLKPSIGNKGRGVYRIERDPSGEFRMSQHYLAPIVIAKDIHSLIKEIRKRIGSCHYIAQQGIPFMQHGGTDFDIRALVQKNDTGKWQVTNVISRIAYPGCFNTSVCENITPTKEILPNLLDLESSDKVMESLSEISLKAATHIETIGGHHQGEVSVDFGIDNHGKLWIIEINGYPQKRLYTHLNDSHAVYKNPILYAKSLLSR
jgi:hypothetical protein